VPVDGPQQRVDVHERPLVDTGQHPGAVDQGQQVPPLHRLQLADVTAGELAQQGAQRGRRVHPTEQPVRPARADHVQVADAVRAGQQPADDRRQLRCRVGRTGSDHLAGEPHMLVQQFRQAGLLGQFQHRDKPGARHQIHVIEHGGAAVPSMRQFH